MRPRQIVAAIGRHNRIFMHLSPGQLHRSLSNDRATGIWQRRPNDDGATPIIANTVQLVDVPNLTGGFQTLEQQVIVPSGVTSLRIVLTGFSPTDISTAGTMTFGDVGLYAE